MIEHGGDGRCVYDLGNARTEDCSTSCNSPTAWPAGPDERYVLVNETSTYRISVTGSRATAPAAMTCLSTTCPACRTTSMVNGQDRFWVALYSPRNPLPGQLCRLPAAQGDVWCAADGGAQAHRAQSLCAQGWIPRARSSLICRMAARATTHRSPPRGSMATGLYLGSR